MNLFGDNTLRKLPDWIPGSAKKRLGGKIYKLKQLPSAIRKRMKTPEKIGVADHVAKYRIVTEPPHTGPWRHDLAPHAIKIMNTYSLKHVREIWFCGVEQAVKTNVMLNCMHWAIDIDPGNVFYLMPSENAAIKIVRRKLIPMIRASKVLKKYVSDKQDDITQKEIQLTNGVTIMPAWANSPTSMATFAAKHLFVDEVDKCPEMSGREASPPVLIRKRGRLYKGRYKCFFASSPAQRFIWDGVNKCAKVWTFKMKCPHCGDLQDLKGENLQVPEGVDPSTYDNNTILGYVCDNCGVEWKVAEYDLAVRSGRWVCTKGDDIARPATVGFHLPAWGCRDIPLYEIAATWVTAANSTKVADKVAWANGYEAKDYVHEQKDREEDFILRLVHDDQPRKVVPYNTWGLIIKADTQQVGFFYQVWAVEWGEALTVWMIEHGRVESFASLEDKRKTVYKNAEGREYLCKAGFIDSGGGTNPARPKHTRTVEVYDFCRKNKFWKPLKGVRTMDNAWDVKRRDFYPASVGKKVPIPGGLLLYKINVTHYKNELDNKLRIEKGDPGAINLHSETGKDFAKQLCAEYQDERGYWICPGSKPNHHWDICVYGLALCDIMGIRDKKKKKKRPPKQAKPRGSSFVTNY